MRLGLTPGWIRRQSGVQSERSFDLGILGGRGLRPRCPGREDAGGGRVCAAVDAVAGAHRDSESVLAFDRAGVRASPRDAHGQAPCIRSRARSTIRHERLPRSSTSLASVRGSTSPVCSSRPARRWRIHYAGVGDQACADRSGWGAFRRKGDREPVSAARRSVGSKARDPLLGDPIPLAQVGPRRRVPNGASAHGPTWRGRDVAFLSSRERLCETPRLVRCSTLTLPLRRSACESGSRSGRRTCSPPPTPCRFGPGPRGMPA